MSERRKFSVEFKREKGFFRRAWERYLPGFPVIERAIAVACLCPSTPIPASAPPNRQAAARAVVVAEGNCTNARGRSV